MNSESPNIGGRDQAIAGDTTPTQATYPGQLPSRPAAREETPQGPETDLWTGRTNWKHYAARFLLLVAIILGGGVGLVLGAQRSDSMTGTQAAGGIFLLAAVAGAILAGPVIWAILSHRYRLTTQRLIIERGILSQTIDQTELVRVDDVRIHKTLADRILGLGSVVVISTDATDREIFIPGVTSPEHLADAIRQRMRAARQRTVYVENV